MRFSIIFFLLSAVIWLLRGPLLNLSDSPQSLEETAQIMRNSEQRQGLVQAFRKVVVKQEIRQLGAPSRTPAAIQEMSGAPTRESRIDPESVIRRIENHEFESEFEQISSYEDLERLAPSESALVADLAVQELERLLEKKETTPKYYFLLHKILVYRSQNLDEVIDFTNKILSSGLEPSDWVQKNLQANISLRYPHVRVVQ